MATVPSPSGIGAWIAHFTPTIRSTVRVRFSFCSSFRYTSVRMTSSTAEGGPIITDAGDIAGNSETSDDVLVQYVVLRRDLIATWPLGSVVTQGCHASVAAIWSHKDDPHTLGYCSPTNLDSMHKVTLEVKGEPQILNLSEKLTAGDIAHKLWIEQPENIPTCLATKPYPKSMVSSFFKKLKLCK
uniref:peptidyl-tRNA hydrolase n=1 Tax=Davidia involucrata TaxID=16924 RepID=A0A5B7CBW3_DAVIN